MNGHDFGAAELPWLPMEETMLLLAREQEWAEAYASDHPQCLLGQFYLTFLRDELVRTMSEL